MKRAVTLLLAAVAGLVLAGLVMAVIVPAAGREGPATAVAVTIGSVAATMAVAVFAMRRR